VEWGVKFMKHLRGGGASYKSLGTSPIKATSSSSSSSLAQQPCMGLGLLQKLPPLFPI
jgi:hypothetical protein